MGRFALILALIDLLAMASGCQTPVAVPDHQVERQVEGYTQALAELDQRIEEARELAAKRKGWGDHELVASLLVQRARLTGRIEDWVAADQTIALAFERAPQAEVLC